MYGVIVRLVLLYQDNYRIVVIAQDHSDRLYKLYEFISVY